MRTAVTITVRMKSTRLPEKAMKDLVGKPMIEHLIDRLKYAKLPDEIILCTSTNPQDDILVEVAQKNNIKWFRGDEVDVLKRLLDASKKSKIDFIVSTTGDNPLTDPHYIDELINKFKETDADYITCLDLPLGAFSYGIKVRALEKVVELKKEMDTEIWGVYFTETNLFKIEKMEVESQLKHPEMRLTVDTPEDFRLMEEIYGMLYKEDKLIELADVINLFRENPMFLEINKNTTQRKAPRIDTSRMRI